MLKTQLSYLFIHRLHTFYECAWCAQSRCYFQVLHYTRARPLHLPAQLTFAGFHVDPPLTRSIYAKQPHALPSHALDLVLEDTDHSLQHLLPSRARPSLNMLSEAAQSLELLDRLLGLVLRYPGGRDGSDNTGAVVEMSFVGWRVEVLQQPLLLLEGLVAEPADPPVPRCVVL